MMAPESTSGYEMVKKVSVNPALASIHNLTVTAQIARLHCFRAAMQKRRRVPHRP
jgi:hypothetical protein